MTHAICSGIAGVLALVLGSLVFAKSRGSSERKVFAWLCLTMFGWLFSYSLMESSSHERFALICARVGHSSVIFVPIAYLHFTSRFLRFRWFVPVYRLYYAVGLVFLYLMWATDLFVPRVVRQPWGFYPIGGPMMLVDSLVCLIIVFLCWTVFVIHCRRAKREGNLITYNRLKWCCIALTLFSLGALDYLPKFGIPYYPLGFLTTTIFVSLASYAILVHRLMNIDLVIRKSLVYSVLVAIMTAVYFCVVLVAEKWFQGMVGYRSFVTSIVAGFAIALGFTPLKELVQRVVDRFFFRGSVGTLAQENERLRQEVTRAERLKAVSTLTAGMAHEIKNPLTAIKTFTEFLPERYDDPEFREKFHRIVGKEVNRINGLVQRLLEFARPSTPQLAPVRVSEVARETLDCLQAMSVQKRIQIEASFAEADEILADRGQLKQALLNIMLNGMEAMEPGGRLHVSTLKQEGHVEILVEDTGPGIPKDALPHIFDPFYTTKEHGTGLGLAVVHSIVTEHGGRIALDTHPNLGTRFTLKFPLIDTPQSAQSATVPGGSANDCGGNSTETQSMTRVRQLP